MATEKRVFCDTNHLLDLCDKGRKYHADALTLMWYAQENASTVKLIASITSFKDAYYILQRLYRDERSARESVYSLMDVCITSVDMLASYGKEAVVSDEPDFDDSLLRACAEHEGACIIISRDEDAFKGSIVLTLSPADFLQCEGFDYETIDW